MSRRKVFTYLLGISFVAGITKASLHKPNKKKIRNEKDMISNFVGNWSFLDPLYSATKTLKIDEQAQLFIDNKPINGSVTSMSPHKLLFTDHYGYELTIRPIDKNTLTLYDSADDKEYTLVSTALTDQ